jgi:hypothetical protein
MSCAVSRGNFPAWRRPDGPRFDLRRLTPEQVARIRAAPTRGVPALAREFSAEAARHGGKGISAVAAWKVARYKTYKDLP